MQEFVDMFGVKLLSRTHACFNPSVRPSFLVLAKIALSLIYVVLLRMCLFQTRYAAEISSRNSHDLSKFCPCL
jgi:hypothetical protein